MTSLLNWRVWVALALVAVLAITHGVAYKTGRALVRADWDKNIADRTAQALAAARLKEQSLQTKIAKVVNDYQAEKSRRSADRTVSANRLSELQAALDRAASADTSTASGANDPRSTIINQCAGALVGLDEYAQGMAAKASALQDYTREVCVN